MTPAERDGLRIALRDLEIAATRIRSMLDPDGPAVDPGEAGDLERRASALLNCRSRLSRHMPGDLFADPAFDMLLDLYVAAERSERRTVKSATVASRAPSTTALRWINVLVEAGMVERSDDPVDRRLRVLRLSETGRRGMQSWLAEGWQEARRRDVRA